MELNHYRLTFDNNKEYLVKTDLGTSEKVMDYVLKTRHLSLQLQEGDPLHILKERLFSIQKVSDGIIGHQSKVWRLL